MLLSFWKALGFPYISEFLWTQCLLGMSVSICWTGHLTGTDEPAAITVTLIIKHKAWFLHEHHQTTCEMFVSVWIVMP